MRNKLGKVLIAAGFVLFLAAFSVAIYNVVEDYRAGEFIDDVNARLDDSVIYDDDESYKIYPDMQMPVVTIDSIDYIGKIKVSVSDIELPVISEWSYDNLRIAPCRYDGSAYSNNMVIAGHNYDSHFRKLNRLSVGDKVVFTDVSGNVFEYTVAELEVLSDTDIQDMLDGEWDLTLFTCTIGGRARFTVRCVSN